MTQEEIIPQFTSECTYCSDTEDISTITFIGYQDSLTGS